MKNNKPNQESEIPKIKNEKIPPKILEFVSTSRLKRLSDKGRLLIFINRFWVLLKKKFNKIKHI